MVHQRAQFLHDARHKHLRIPEQHDRFFHVVQLIVDPGKTRAHTALDRTR